MNPPTFAQRVAAIYSNLERDCCPFVPSLAEIEAAFQPLVTELHAMSLIQCVAYVTDTFHEAPPVARHVMAMYRDQVKFK